MLQCFPVCLCLRHVSPLAQRGFARLGSPCTMLKTSTWEKNGRAMKNLNTRELSRVVTHSTPSLATQALFKCLMSKNVFEAL